MTLKLWGYTCLWRLGLQDKHRSSTASKKSLEKVACSTVKSLEKVACSTKKSLEKVACLAKKSLEKV